MPEVVSDYAGRFTALAGGRHAVGSPLGVWLLLALVAPAATGERAAEIVGALGVDADTARRAALELLDHPHPAVSAAVAAWMRDGLDGLDAWRTSLPDVVDIGPIPSPQQADAWAHERTLGLIEKFPLDVSDALVVLASALATRVTWRTPFDVAEAAELRGPWSSAVTTVLSTPGGPGHRVAVVDTARAGRVAVHRASADHLDVVSVIAEPDVAPAEVLAAAHGIAVAWSMPGPLQGRLSLFDLPLGDHPLWTITEVGSDRGGERAGALLPAWHAGSEHKLLQQPGLAVGPALRTLQELAQVNGPNQAVQSAVARYGRRGFEAAAVTGMAVAASAALPRPGPFRTATVRFGHPYAVVATAQGRDRNDPWYGLPVFAAWVAEPDEVED